MTNRFIVTPPYCFTVYWTFSSFCFFVKYLQLWPVLLRELFYIVIPLYHPSLSLSVNYYPNNDGKQLQNKTIHVHNLVEETYIKHFFFWKYTVLWRLLFISRVKILSFAKKSVYPFKHRLEKKQKPSHSIISFSVSTFEENVWKHVFELVYWLKEKRVPNKSDIDKWQMDSKY